MRKNLLYNENSSLKRELDQRLREQSLPASQYTPVTEVRDISAAAFKDEFVTPQRPVVIRGGARDWAALSRWDFDFFARSYGDVEVVANLYDVQTKRKSTFRELVAVLQSPTYEQPTYLQEWWFQENCPELLNDMIVPEFFADDLNKTLLGFHNNTLWIGQKGAFTPIHQDTAYTNVWSAQIMGAKEWILIDKHAQILARDDGTPDYEAFFAAAENRLFKTVLDAGDILYMPHKWWHRAETLEHAISLNTFYITPDIVQNYLRDILSIPFAALLNQELLQTYDPMRYNICVRRSEILTKMLGLNAQNILGVDTSGKAVEGIYGKRAS